jgi:hypothetical protein
MQKILILPRAVTHAAKFVNSFNGERQKMFTNPLYKIWLARVKWR